MKEKYLLILILAWGAIGCGLLKKDANSPVMSPEVIVEQPVIGIDEGHLTDEKRFGEGGKLLVIPFTAGVGVTATDELDRLSLLMVKEIAHVLETMGTDKFQLLTAENADEADLIIEGRVTEMTAPPGKLKKWVPGHKVKRLGLSGKMVDRNTGKSVAHFSHTVEGNQKTSLEAMASQLGTMIGQFLADHIVEQD